MKLYRLILFLPLLFPFVSVYPQVYQLRSPDNNIQLDVKVSDDISLNVSYKNEVVIEKILTALELQDEQFHKKLKVRNTTKGPVKEKIFPVIANKDSLIMDKYNQMDLQFGNDFTFIVRAYDEGFAFRYVYRKDNPLTITSEKLKISFPENTSSYFPLEESMYSHNERKYIYTELDTLKKGEFCSLPVVFNVPGSIRVLVTESSLYNYPGMFITGSEGNTIEALFPHFVLETRPNTDDSPDRNVIISREADYIAQINEKRALPWRVFMVSDDDRTFVESNLVFQLSEPVAIEETGWIKPGKVAWDWYNANNIFGVDFRSGLNTQTYKYYIDFAASNNIEYVILDEGWTKSTTEILEFNPQIDVKELINYGKSKNVGIILWVLWKPLNDNLEEILETYAGWGAKGIKVDFMQRSDQTMVASYEEIAKVAARNHLLVDYHGAFKPSGLRRKYPNILNFEGVRGNEHYKWSREPDPEHNVTIPFIRMAAGPMDYTPGSMKNANPDNHNISFDRPMTLGTRCHQVAMYIVYESPLQMLCENPSVYKKEQETLDFISKIPTTWDETIVLKAKLSDHIVVARRNDEKWYVGAMTDWNPKEFDIPLSFLAEGEYTAEIMKDGINADRYAEDYRKEELRVNTESVLHMNLSSGGGWAAIISKSDN